MISWTTLIAGKENGNGSLRYGARGASCPKVIVWNVTRRCNLRCLHCYANGSNVRNEGVLGDEEASDFIRDIAALGVKVLIFSGGEPLLENRIFKWALEAEKNGLKAALSTNGTLIGKDTAQRLKESGFSYAGISLDGVEAINDAFRQKIGAFQRSLAGLRHCKRAGLKTGIRFTLTRRNRYDVPFIFEIAMDEGVDRFCIYHLVYTGRGMNLMADDLSAQEKREVLDVIWQNARSFVQNNVPTEVLTVDNHADGAWLYLKLRKENPGMAEHCLELLLAQGGNSSGVGLAAIGSDGSIYPDQFFTTHALGNVREERFSDVWREKRPWFLDALRDRQRFIKGRCARCKFFPICNGNMRSRAESFYKDIWQEDPACYLSEEEIENDAAPHLLGNHALL